MRKSWPLFTGLILLLTVVGCNQPASPENNQQPAEEQVSPAGGDLSFTITSTAFADGTNIPVKYSCNGQNISPPLNWSGIPAGTASLALIMDDPDAVYTHWVVFNLPPDEGGLPEAVPKDEELANGALQGKLGSGGIGYPTGYFGPCPPKGSAHHYRFTLYALDNTLDVSAGASKDQVLQAMEGHILGQTQLVGIYQRQSSD
jgi:Raf kinase inhibitor-like YbhB/YbcL family protein